MTEKDKQQDWFIRQFALILQEHSNQLNKLIKQVNRDVKFNKLKSIK